MLIKEIYKNARIVNSGNSLTTVNEFTDQLPALRPQVLIEVAYEILKHLNFEYDKIVTEEDKGAPLATAISLLSGKPLAIARWYPYSLSELNNNVVDIKSEYFEGKMFLNGIKNGDRVLIIDDTISTGGAIISLVNSIESAGGKIMKIICAVEKSRNKGIEKVKKTTGHTVETIIKIDVTKEGVSVIE